MPTQNEVFLSLASPTPTHLTILQSKLYDMLSTSHTEVPKEYHSESWMVHCTVAQSVTSNQFHRAIKMILEQINLPATVIVEQFSLVVEFPKQIPHQCIICSSFVNSHSEKSMFAIFCFLCFISDICLYQGQLNTI